MRPILFKCSTTGRQVQALIPAVEGEELGQGRFQPVQCHACRGVHLINVATGKVIGDD